MLNMYISIAISVLLGVCCCSLVVGDESFGLETTPTTIFWQRNSSSVTAASHSNVPSTPSRATHGDVITSTGTLEPLSSTAEGSGVGLVSEGDSDSDFATHEFTTIQEYLTDEFLLPTSDKVYHSSSTSKPTSASTVSHDVLSTDDQSKVTTVTEPVLSSSVGGVDHQTQSEVLEQQSSYVTSSPVPEFTTSPIEEPSSPEMSGPLASATELFVLTTSETSVTLVDTTIVGDEVSTVSTDVDTATTGTEMSSHDLQVTTADESIWTESSTMATTETHAHQQVTDVWTSTPALTTSEVPGLTETSTSEVPDVPQTPSPETTGVTPAFTTIVEVPGSTDASTPEVPVFTDSLSTETSASYGNVQVSTEPTVVSTPAQSETETTTESSETTTTTPPPPYVVGDTTTAADFSTVTTTTTPPPIFTSEPWTVTSTTSDDTTTVTTHDSHSTESGESAVTTTDFPEILTDGFSVTALVNTSSAMNVTATTPSTPDGSPDGGHSGLIETTELPIMKNVKSYDNLTEAEFFNSVTVIFRKPVENRDSDLLFFNQDVFKKVVICLINAYEFEGWTNETTNETVCDYENKGKSPAELSENFQALRPNDLVIVYPSPKTSDDTELVSFFVKNSSSTVTDRIVARNHTLTALDRHRQFLADQMKMEVAEIESRIPVQLLITNDGHRSFGSLLLVVLLASVLFCILIIATGVVCIKWRSQSGRWHKKNHDKVSVPVSRCRIAQLQGNAMRSETGAHHLNSDEDIRKDENQLAWKNGNGHLDRGNSKNGNNRYENGGGGETVIPITENESWVVPLTPEEKRVPDTLDTKL